MEKLRVFFIAIMLCLPLCSVFSQIADIKTLSEEDTYREKLLSDTEISSRNKTWEGVALSLLVPDIEKSAEDSGLESFSISITDNTINIIYRDIRFQPNSAEVTPETITKLQKLSKILKRFSEMGLVIEGHTAKLSESDNDDGMELSENRAKSVAAVIAETGIFEAKNIHAVGKGFYEPVEEGFSAENKALNRRVEISIGGAPDSEDGKSTEEKSETLWWDFLSKSMNPGYTACLVHNKTVEEVQAALSEAGIDGLILAPTEDGVGILDSSMAFRMNDSPNTKSVEHIKALGKALASLGKDTEVRVGGYNTAIKEESIEERHYLTAYTMASVGGLSPDKIFFGKEGHVLTKSTTALVSKSISKVDGTILETEDIDNIFSVTVPFETDSVKIMVEAQDPKAVITGLPLDASTLDVGKNDIVVTVETTARPQKFTEEYTFSVVRKPIPGTTLKDLTIIDDNERELELSPSFSPDVTEYVVTVPYSVQTVTVNPEKEDSSAILEAPEAPVAVKVGDNEILSTVTTQTKIASTEYKVIVKKSSPALETFTATTMKKDEELEKTDLNFNPATDSYNMLVPFKAKNIKLDAILNPADKAAGAKVEVLTDTSSELEVGLNTVEVRITDAEGNSYNYTVNITRDELLPFRIEHEWFVTPAASFYINGMGASFNGGINFGFTDDSEISLLLKPLRLGAGAFGHWATGNYITVFSAGGYIRGGYELSTDDWYEYRWFLPTAFLPRIDLGASYMHYEYSNVDKTMNQAAFYASPGVRMNFIMPFAPDLVVGIDASYVLHIGSTLVDYFNLGLTVAF